MHWPDNATKFSRALLPERVENEKQTAISEAHGECPGIGKNSDVPWCSTGNGNFSPGNVVAPEKQLY